jgi:hypothetical protein
MKRILTTLILALSITGAFAQTNIPQLVSFSAVVRDQNNNPLVNTAVSLRLTFREGGQNGPLVYCALHQNITNANGFVSIQLNRNVLGIGCNSAPSTAFEEIPWENGAYWMEVEYQTNPGNPFVSLGQLELATSFYAFAARTAESISGFNLNGAQGGDILVYNSLSETWEVSTPQSPFSGNYNDLINTPQNVSSFNNDVGYITDPNDADNDPTNELQSWNTLPGIPAGFADGVDDVNDGDTDPTNELQDWNSLPGIPVGFADGLDNVNDGDTDPTNELQDWNSLPGIPAGFADGVDDVNDGDTDPTNELQDWNSLPGIPAGFADGVDDVDDADISPLNEIQSLSVTQTGDTLHISNGNWVIIPGISQINN